MLSKQETVWCPVGNHVPIGYRTRGIPVTLICRECGFSFPFDKQGKQVEKPTKVITTANKRPIRYCGPDGCHCHG